MSHVGLAVGIAVCVVATARANADSAAAAAATAQAAEAAAAQHQYDEAAAKFRDAYRLDPRPEYFCNVGVAYQRAKQWPRAQLYLGECLVRGNVDPQFTARVRAALGTVEQKLRDGDYTPVDVSVVPATASIAVGDFATDEAFIGPRVIWLPFGAHDLTASADGYLAHTEAITARDHGRAEIHFELAKRPPPPSEFVRVVERQPSLALPITMSGIAVAFGAVGIGFWLDARSVMTGANSTTITREQYDDIVDRANTRKYIGWAAGGIGGAAAIAAGILWWHALRAPSVEVAPMPGGAAISLGGAW
jgi:hypothetical protein